MRALRALSGVVAAGTVVLAAVVTGSAVIGARDGFPGPGTTAVLWHLIVGAIVIAAQIYSDRRRGFAAFSGSMVVLLAAGILLWTQWWR
ncbi:hypothetical protein D5S18_00060 [Nocardia panacis]|uniref:Uncharacterized protein n=1 Tax=Nocardia panacis TaxID=2340916 RepID=A0A3A4KDS7_9NOCA|nr:hypothetical protein [Nocardia panacis]RJO80358.1 hypothetical protein D5S18_00060 [Nocardia panacis]